MWPDPAHPATHQGRAVRREETAFSAGWLYDRLVDRFGGGQVFKDVDSIQLGDDFVEMITAAVGSCDVLLALVGDQWLTITDSDGRRRLDDPDDFVRVEIEAALTRNVRVIPILVDGATMPRADELPASLARLVRRHALELSPARFEYDTGRLLTVLDRTLSEVRTAHDDAAAASASAGKATDPCTTDLPKASEPAQGGKKAAEQRARDQEARDPRLAPAGAFPAGRAGRGTTLDGHRRCRGGCGHRRSSRQGRGSARSRGGSRRSWLSERRDAAIALGIGVGVVAGTGRTT